MKLLLALALAAQAAVKAVSLPKAASSSGTPGLAAPAPAISALIPLRTIPPGNGSKSEIQIRSRPAQGETRAKAVMSQARPWLESGPAVAVPEAAPAAARLAPARRRQAGGDSGSIAEVIALTFSFPLALWLAYLIGTPSRKGYYRVGWRTAAWIGVWTWYHGWAWGPHLTLGSLGLMSAGALWALSFPRGLKIPERRIEPSDED